MKFSFTSQDGQCPACNAFGRKWYIQDRYIGGDVYEYCLMSVSSDPPQRHQFGSRSEVAMWLNDDGNVGAEYDKDVAEYIIRRHTEREISSAALLEKKGVQYRLDKEKHILTIIQERKQETGWFGSYYECLNMAKEILQNMSKEQSGEQMTLFGQMEI